VPPTCSPSAGVMYVSTCDSERVGNEILEIMDPIPPLSKPLIHQDVIAVHLTVQIIIEVLSSRKISRVKFMC
jgi:hypothetical protein